MTTQEMLTIGKKYAREGLTAGAGILNDLAKELNKPSAELTENEENEDTQVEAAPAALEAELETEAAADETTAAE